MDCNEARKLIERSFVSQDPSAMPRAHIAVCGSCQEVYSALFEAEAHLGEAPGALSVAEKEMLRAAVLPQASRASRPRLLYYAAAAAAACVLVVVALVLRSTPPREELTPRGERSSGAGAPVGIRALCITPSEQREPRVRSLTGEEPSCSRSGSLGLTYRNETAEPWHLQVVLVDAEARAWQVHPATGGQSALPPVADEAPLELSYPLARIASGRATLYGLLSREPLAEGKLLDAVHRPDRLTTDGSLVTRQVIVVTD